MKIQTFVHRKTGQVVYGFQYDISAKALGDAASVMPDGLEDAVLKHSMAGDRHLVSGQFVVWGVEKVIAIYDKKEFESRFATLNDEDIRCVDLMQLQFNEMRRNARMTRIGLATVEIPRTLYVRVNALLDAVESFDALLREDNRRQAVEAGVSAPEDGGD